MRKKIERIRRKRNAKDIGICFEPLEPRLLLSGSWAAGMESPSPDLQLNTRSDFTQETGVPFDSAGASGVEALQQSKSQPGIGTIVDILAAAPAIEEFAAADPVPETASSEDQALPASSETETTPLDDADAQASNPELQPALNDAAGARELVFVDETVADYEQLIADLQGSADNRIIEVVVLESERNGIEQVSETLSDRSDLTAVHFITHGADGQINLGDTCLDSTTLQQNRDAVAGWGNALTETGDILFYGCNIAAGSAGQSLLNGIADLTGADVAASNDTTGHENLGGDWQLETKDGQIETALAPSANFQQHWNGLLATYTVTSTANAGAGTLRQAITDANTNAGADSIVFNIAGTGTHTIAPTAALPTIQGQVTIDATTDDSFAANSNRPAIIVAGTNAGLGQDGLVLTSTADGSVIRGLVIRDWGADGISIQANSNNNLIAGNYIGRINPDGTAGAADTQNDGDGIYILGANNTIGGTTAADRNVISGNDDGVTLDTGATGNVVIGNYIGTDATGAIAVGNTLNAGVWIKAGSNNRIGGAGANEGNLIANNAGDGVFLQTGAGTGNSVLGNSSYSNSGLGIDLGTNGVTANDAGDGDTGANNLQNFPVLTSANSNASGTTIVGSLNSNANTTLRIEYFANRPTVADAPNGEGERFLGFITVTTDGSGNASVNTTLSNVWVNSGDRISATATVDLGGGNYGSTSEFAANVTASSTGIVVVDTTSDAIGGTTSSITNLGANRGADDRISLREAIIAANNTANGGTPDKIVFAIPVTDANHYYYRDNGVAGTFATAVTTTLADAQISDFDADYLAGTARSWYRISLSGNYLDVTQAVIIDGSTQAGYSVAAGPVIEINAAGITTAGDENAIALTSGASTIRGLVINSAGDNAIEIDVNADNSVIVGNYLGTDVSGTQARGNATLAAFGALAVKADGVVIGGTTAADRNVISGNVYYGIEIYSSASGSSIRGNYIGTRADGSGTLGNGLSGIYLQGGAFNHTIGGTAANQGNLIASNGGDGVWVGATAGAGNAILGNSIHSNTGQGVDLGADGVTANDVGDADTGANNLQNFPVLTSATATGAQVTFTGTLNSTASTQFRIEFFASTAQDGTGYGEGQRYLGFGYVTTDGSGNATINTTLAVTVTAGEFISATATKSNAGFTVFTDTSEFGQNVAAIRINTAPTYSSGDGIMSTNFGAGSTDFAFATAIQPDGKILAAGYTSVAGTNDFALVRYNSDGSLDTSFGGGDGIVTTAVGLNSDIANGMAVLSNGKILLVGNAVISGSNQIALVQYNADGTLDTSFGGGDGIATSGIVASDGNSIAIQADGKIVVVGTYSSNFLVARFNSDGTLDTGFGSSGSTSVDFNGSTDIGNSVVIQSDGKIVMSGRNFSGTSFDFAMARFNTNGTLDTSFDGDGKVTTDIGTNSDDNGYRLTLQSDGKIVVAGWSDAAGTADFALARYNSNGSLDTTFSGDGKLTTSIGSGGDLGQAVTVQSDGKIIVAGQSSSAGNNFGVVRYLADGTLDTSFNGTGIVDQNFGGSSDDRAIGVLVQSDGKIVVAGTSTIGGDYDFAIARYTTTGAIDTRLDLANTLGGTVGYIENGSAVVLDTNVMVFDAELAATGNYAGASLTLARNGGASAQDVYSATGTLSALTQGGSLVVGGTTVGTVTTNSSGTLVLTFNANATNARVNSVMQQIAYSNNSDAPPATAQINWTFNDNNSGTQGTGGPLSATGSTTVSITPANDAPVAAITPATYAATEQVALTLKNTGLSISDVDAASGSMTVTLSVTEGTLTVTAGGSGALVSNSGTSSVTITGTVTQINNLLSTDATSTVSYTDNIDAPSASATLTLQVNDNGNTGGGSLTNSDTATINITAVNDAPVATITPATYAATEQVALTLHGTGLSIADIDAGSAAVRATVSVTSGILTAAAGTTGVTVTGSGTATVTLDGTLTQINNLLAGSLSGTLTYTANSDTPAASATLTLTASDLGNTGAGGTLTGSDTATINITAVNDAPTATITPATYAATEQVALTLHGTGLSIADVDAGGAAVRATVSVTSGILTAATGTTGVTVTGSGTATVTLDGTLTQINNLLAGSLSGTLTYTANSDTPAASATLTLTASDLGNTGTGGTLTGSDTATINITAVNDAPVATITPATYAATEQVALTLKNTGLSISDVDAASGSMTVTLSVTEGTLTVTAGGSGALVNNSGTASVTITGTVTQINNLLSTDATSTVSYTDGTDTPSASATLTLQVNDNGNTGGGSLTNADTATINITAVNDAPVITSDGGGVSATLSVQENTTAVTTVTSTDVDGGAASYSILAGGDAARFTINPVTGALSFLAAPDYENPTDAGLDNVYNLTVQVSDGSGVNPTDTQAITVTVTNVADGIRVTPVSVVALGGETRVNTSTSDNQIVSANTAQAIATDAVGNFIVVWMSNLQDGALYGVYAQRYNAAGVAQGSEFRVNTTTADNQINPAVAMDAAGNFVVTWSSNNQDGSGNGVYAQRFNAAGVAQGAEFLVNTTTVGGQSGPAVAMATNGDFVIAWTGSGQDPDASSGIYAQRFNASGVAQGGEFRINTYTANAQQITSAAMDASGNFVVTWASDGQDGSGYGVYGQRFDASGVAQGAEFRVNTTTANTQLYHDVAMLPDGRLVVAYQSRNADNSYEVYLQRYAANGTPIGGETHVNTVTVASTTQPIPSVSADAGGNITVVWNSTADGAGDGVVGRRFYWSGTPVGAEFQVNTTTSGNQLYPEVVSQPGGRFIVAWGGNGSGDADGVFMQRYGLATTEAGGTATFSVVLDAAPTANVVIPISIPDGTEGTVSAPSLTFTTADWNIAQTVTVTGVQDFSNDHDVAFTVVLGTATSTDLNFNGLNPTDLSVVNREVANVAPVNTVPAAQTVNEDTALVFSSANGNAITVSDADAGTINAMQVTLSVTNGVLTLGGVAGLSFSSGANGSATMTFTGTIASINTALNGLRFDPTADFNGAATLTLDTNDQGNTGAGGAQSDNDTVAITVNAVNDAPIRTAGSVANLTVLEDSSFTSLGFGGVAYSPGGGTDESGQTLTYQITILPNTTTFGKVYLADGTTQVTLNSFYTLGEIRGMQFQPAADKTGTTGFAFNVADSGGTANGGIDYIQEFMLITITAVNDAPVLADTALTLTVAEDAGVPVGAVGSLVSAFTGGISDVDSGALKGIAITASNETNGTWWYSTNSGSNWTAVGSVSSAQSLLLTDSATTRLYFQPNADYSGGAAAALTIRAWDRTSGTAGTKVDTSSNGGTTAFSSATDVVDVTVTAVNDAPVATITPATYTATEQVALTLKNTGLSISDVDAGAGSMTVTLSVTEGTLTVTAGGSSAVVTNSGTSSVTITGTVTQINNLLSTDVTSTVSYIDNIDAPSASATLTLQVNDNGNTGGGSLTNSDTATINITPVNDAPTATITPATYAATEQVALTLHGTGLSIADVDAGGAAVRATVSVTSGILTAAAGTTGVTVTGSGTASVTLDGTLTQINDLLAGNLSGTLTYTLNSDTPAASATLTLTASDLGNTGTGGTLTGNDTAVINITAVNDAPVVTIVPATYSATEQTNLVLHGTGISVADADAGAATINLTLSVGSGTLTVVAGTTGVSAGAAGSSVLVIGTIAQLNDLLAGNLGGTITYVSASDSPPASTVFTVSLNDAGVSGTGGPQTGSDTATINLTAVNDAPTATITPATYAATEQVALTLHGTGLSIADVDTGGAVVRATVSVTSGILTAAAGTTGVTVTGSGTATVTLDGTLTQINDLLAGSLSGTLTYTLNSDTPPASDTLTLTASDLGNTGSGGTLTGSDTATINITAVNDAPTATITPATYAATEKVALTLHGTGLSIADVDAGAAAVRATVSVTSGILTAAAGTTGVTVTGSGTASVTLDGTLTQINNLLAGNLSGTLTYTANSDTPAASATLTLTASDLGNTGTGGTLTGSDTATINITAVNDTPTITSPATIAVMEDVASSLTGISFADVDAGGNSVQVTLTASTGHLSAVAGGGVTVSMTPPDLILTGSIADINTFIAAGNLTFLTAEHDVTTSLLRIVINDLGNSGSGVAPDVTAYVDLVVTPVNDGPVRTAGTVNNLSVLEDSGLTSLGLGGLAFGPGGGADEAGQTLTYQVTTIPSAASFGSVYLADGTTVVGTGTYSLAQIQGMQFRPTANKNGGPSFFGFQVIDSGGTANGGVDTLGEFIQLNITPVNDAPVIITTAAPLAYTENDPATAIDPGLNVSDVDNTNLTGATVTISANYANGQDLLGFTNQLGITGSWSAATGVLTLSGTTTVANYRTALRSVTFVNSSDAPSTLTRTISFVASDGTANSIAATRDISITPVNDASVLAAVEGTSLAYSENAAATAITATITASDLDNTNLAGATIQITGNYQNGQDVLSFTNTGSITGSWNATNGTLTLSGSDTVANYQAALRDVKYQNTSDNPSGLTRTVSFTVNDGTVSSNTVIRNIAVTPVNDAPVATITPVTYAATEQVALTLKNTGLSINDVDAGTGSMTVTLSVTEGTLTVTAGGSGAVVTNSGTSSVTITGTVTQINNLLSTDATSTVSYTDNTDTPSASATLTLQVNDNGNTGGGPLTNSDSATINITEVNDPPVLAAIGNQSVNEGATLTFTATATDADLPGQTLTYLLDAASLALGMTINSATGAFSWTRPRARAA